MLKFQEHQQLDLYQHAFGVPDDDTHQNDDDLLTEASARSLAPAAALAVIIKKSLDTKTALRKMRDKEAIEDKLDALSEALDYQNSKSTAISALVYFVAKQSTKRLR